MREGRLQRGHVQDSKQDESGADGSPAAGEVCAGAEEVRTERFKRVGPRGPFGVFFWVAGDNSACC